MTLIDRLRPPTTEGESQEIAFHVFSSAMFLLIDGSITLTQFKTGLKLNATDDAQVTILQNHYGTLSTAKKASFRDLVESAGILWETGKITESKFISLVLGV